MNNPKDLKYATSHEWLKLEGDKATVGITKFAVEQLTEPTFLELPKVGQILKAGQPFGVIESVKSTSDIYSPATGEVIEVNQNAVENLNLVNDDPFGAGWLIKLQLTETNLDQLLSAEQYDAQIAGH